MAAPATVTSTTIVTEALKRAGYPNPGTALITRAIDYWLEEAKHDIWQLAKKLKSLHTTVYQVTTEYLNKYSVPTDFSSDLTVTAFHGANTGAAQAGTNTTVTLAATEDVASDFIKGKKIFIYGGTGVNSLSQCVAYNSTTKVATVSPAWATNPTTGSTYMVVDRYYPLEQTPLWSFDNDTYPTVTGTPEEYFPLGDTDDGEILIKPTPHHISDVPFGLQFRYYADLTRLDLAGTLIGTVYRRWKNELTAGVIWRALEDQKDERAQSKEQIYRNILLPMLVARETYGNDLSNLTATIDS